MMKSLNKFSRLHDRSERSRDSKGFTKSQKISKNTITSLKKNGRRISYEGEGAKTVFLSDSNNSYVMSKIQCCNSRPISRSKIKSPLISKQNTNNRYKNLNISKNT